MAYTSSSKKPTVDPTIQVDPITEMPDEPKSRLTQVEFSTSELIIQALERLNCESEPRSDNIIKAIAKLHGALTLLR